MAGPDHEGPDEGQDLSLHITFSSQRIPHTLENSPSQGTMCGDDRSKGLLRKLRK